MVESGGYLAPVTGREAWIVSVIFVLDCVKESCDLVNRDGFLLPQAVGRVPVFLAQIADAVGVFRAYYVRILLFGLSRLNAFVSVIAAAHQGA